MTSGDTLGGMRKLRYFLALSCVIVLIPAMASCGSSSASPSTEPVGQIELTPASKVIDVRSAEEFAAGHVKGATNLDYESGQLESSLSGLDKDVPYSLYCRSGRRSALAAQLMKDAGFTNVTDLGAMENAAKSLALPIVTN